MHSLEMRQLRDVGRPYGAHLAFSIASSIAFQALLL